MCLFCPFFPVFWRFFRLSITSRPICPTYANVFGILLAYLHMCYHFRLGHLSQVFMLVYLDAAGIVCPSQVSPGSRRKRRGRPHLPCPESDRRVRWRREVWGCQSGAGRGESTRSRSCQRYFHRFAVDLQGDAILAVESQFASVARVVVEIKEAIGADACAAKE